MLLSKKSVEAGKVCLAEGLPFAIVLVPSSSESSFFAALSTCSCGCGGTVKGSHFVISRFGKVSPSELIEIGMDLSPEEILEKYSQSNQHSVPLLDDCGSTAFEDHCGRVERIVASRDDINSKVVLSRRISLSSGRDPFEVAEDYFGLFPDCFRSIYYTAETGLWIVASPEMLLCHDGADNSYRTVSLAGTRTVSDGGWDEKNICEQRLVTDYISDCFRDAGLEAVVGPSENVRFGQIEHRCNAIRSVGTVPPLEVALRLSPTPALCGYPVAEAFEMIESLEDFDRECYGGFIGIVAGSKTELYVNLRSCRCGRSPSDGDRWNYRLFAGGGVNIMSVPRLEWEETERKSARLRDVIMNGIHK